MKIIYISGPFTDADPVFGTQKNIIHAMEVAKQLADNGIGFLCPHANSAGFQHYKNLSHDFWMQMDLTMLAHCDAIIMLKGWERSKGAVMEFRQARELKLPIYYEKDGIPEVV